MATKDEKNRIMTKTVKKNDCRDVSAEYTLPDYLPDVNRLLRVSATASIPEKYCSADTAEYEGNIHFSILYASSEGELSCAEFDTDYAGNLSLGDADDFSVVDILAATENASCRLQSPRKLTAKAKLCISLSVTRAICAEPSLGGKLTAEAEGSLRYKKRELEFLREIKAQEIATPVSEDIETEPGMPQISRIVCIGLSPTVFTTTASREKLSYSGAFLADILYEGENGEHVCFCREIPVSGVVETEGICESSVALCLAEASGVTFRPQTNELGETKTVEIDFDYNVYFSVFTNETCAVTEDAYSLGFETSSEKQALKYLTMDSFKSFNFSLNESEDLPEEEICRVVCANACAVVSSAEKYGSKISVGGTVCFHAVLGAQDGSFSGKSFSFPFKAESDGGKFSELFSYRASVCPCCVNARIAGGKIYFDCEINVCLAIFGEKETESLLSVTVFTDRPTENPPENSIVLYFPQKGDDIWSIAKKYCVTEESLTLSNNLTKDALEGGALIIPSKK